MTLPISKRNVEIYIYIYWLTGANTLTRTRHKLNSLSSAATRREREAGNGAASAQHVLPNRVIEYFIHRVGIPPPSMPA